MKEDIDKTIGIYRSMKIYILMQKIVYLLVLSLCIGLITENEKKLNVRFWY